MYAAQHDQAYAVRFLVEHRGAKPCLRDSDGNDALFYAMKRIEVHLSYRLSNQLWRPDDEEALVAYEENIFAALAGPTDPVQYEAMFPQTVTRLRRTACMLLKRRGGLHCSSRSVKPRAEL
jgi:hypothetical protein